MSNKYYLFAVVSGFVCAQAYGKATLVNNQWQKVDGDGSGFITNVVRWDQGHLPQIGERLYTWNRAADYTLSFSEEDFASPANLRVGATLKVANYTGAAPDASNWRLVGNGETAGKFIAAGGVITAEVTPKNC